MRSKIAEKISAKTSKKTKTNLKKFVDELIVIKNARYKVLKVVWSDNKNEYVFVFTYSPINKPVRREYNVKTDYNNDYNNWKRQLRTVDFIDEKGERKAWNMYFALNNKSIEKTWSALLKGIAIDGDLILIEKILTKDKDTKESISSFKAYLNVPNNFTKEVQKLYINKNERLVQSFDKSMSEMFRQHDYRNMYDFYISHIKPALLKK